MRSVSAELDGLFAVRWQWVLPASFRPGRLFAACRPEAHAGCPSCACLSSEGVTFGALPSGSRYCGCWKVEGTGRDPHFTPLKDMGLYRPGHANLQNLPPLHFRFRRMV